MKDSFFNQKSQCFYKTNLKARINLEKCKRCYKCVSRCPQNAIIMGENGYPKVDIEKCNGCQFCKKSCIDFYYPEIQNGAHLKMLNASSISNILIKEVENYLKKYDLLNSTKCLIVGFSGGYDSYTLLHILCKLREKYKFKLCAAHLNHGWRAGEAEKEEKNCRNFCVENNIEFYSEKLAITVAKTETAAREARYEFFSRSAIYFKTDILLTAHNKTDNVETLIYRITKGTGIKGLRGIEDKRTLEKLTIYRPILGIARPEIEAYCALNNLVPNTDSSNFDTKYKRNFIRHEIIPQLEKINPNVSNAINILSENAKENEDIIEEYLDKLKKQVFDAGKIKTNKFKKLSKSVQLRFIYNLIIENNLDYDRKKIFEILDFILNSANSKSGKTLSLTNNLWLFCSKDEIYLIKKTAKKSDIKVKINDFSKIYEFNHYKFFIEKFNDNNLKFPKESEYYAYVDLSGQEYLELRYRKAGDKFQPFGMNNLIKLKDFFINKGVPKHKKDRIVLLCNHDEVLWACSVGLSEKLRVTNKPTHIIRIEEVRNDD